MRVVIIGCGIGGATLALSLHRAGIDAVVYEAAISHEEIGVGINVLPHATRELTELGLQDRLAATAIETGALAYFTKYGHRITREPRGLAAGYRWPQYSIHRGKLLKILVDAVEERFGKGHVHTAHRFVGFEQDAGEITAHFVHPTNGKALASARGDVLVGVDGIHSTLRRQLFPEEGPPKFTGITMWRGVTEQAPLLDGRTMVLGGDWQHRVVAYPISREAADRGSSLINWVAEVRDSDRTDWNWENWDKRARKDDFLPTFADWRFDWLDVPAMMRKAEVVFEFPMADRDPLPRWSFDRVTLLGDAAHPMYPSGSNGAAQAIIDARVLASILAASADPVAALRSYEAERRAPTARIVEANRAFAAERILQLADERCPANASNIEQYVSQAEIDEISTNYKRLAGFDADALNARASYDDASWPPK